MVFPFGISPALTLCNKEAEKINADRVTPKTLQEIIYKFPATPHAQFACFCHVALTRDSDLWLDANVLIVS